MPSPKSKPDRTTVRLTQTVAEYDAYMIGQGYKDNTLGQKRQTVRALVRAVNDMTDGQAGSVRMGNLEGWHVEEMFNSNSWGATTHELHRTNLAQFFKWCRSRGYMYPHHQPEMNIRRRKRPKELKRRIPYSEWAGLFARCEHPSERILIALGLYLMLRGGEISALRIGDVDLAARTVMVTREKTDEMDEMPIPDELHDELIRWFAAYRELTGHKGLPQNWFLVPAREKGGALDKHGVKPTVQISRPYNYVRPILVRTGYYETGEGAHTLRRSGARALFDDLRSQGYDGALEIVQAMLGHARKETTERYIGLTLGKVRRNEKFTDRPMFSKSREDAALEAMASTLDASSDTVPATA